MDHNSTKHKNNFFWGHFVPSLSYKGKRISQTNGTAKGEITKGYFPTNIRVTQNIDIKEKYTEPLKNQVIGIQTYPLTPEKTWTFQLPQSERNAIYKTVLETYKTCYHQVRKSSNNHYPWFPLYLSLPFLFKYLIIGIITSLLLCSLDLQLHQFIATCQLYLTISNLYKKFFLFLSTAVPILDFLSIPLKLLKLKTNDEVVAIGRWNP